MAVLMQTDLKDVPVSQEGGSSDFSRTRCLVMVSTLLLDSGHAEGDIDVAIISTDPSIDGMPRFQRAFCTVVCTHSKVS